jgi:catechol 2,3-dioxygenase-like lactoylglutathione lyase family enzyme
MISIKETNVTLMVKDMDSAIKFYESIGLTLKNRWEDHYAMMETAGLTIGLHPTSEKKTGSLTVSIGFMIEKLPEAQELLENNKIAFSSASGKSGKYLHFHDPDGTVLYFVEPGW